MKTRKHVEEAVEAAKKVVADEKASKEDLEKAAQELNDKIMPIGAKMYENASKEAGSEKTETKDDSIEGEVVDEEKTDK